jgi:hypothetical protein
MALRLANETDCTFFAFWHETQVFQGINCQGELFVILTTVPLKQQSQAYSIASEVDQAIGAALIVRTKTDYIIGADLRRKGWQVFIVKDVVKDVVEENEGKDKASNISSPSTIL